MLVTLIQIDGYDPVTASPVSLYASSVDDPAACHLDGKTWYPAVAKLPVLRYDFFDGAFGDQISAPSSSLTIQTELWPDFGRYQLADARFQLWTGNLGDAWGGYTKRFDGRIGAQPKVKDGQASIDFAVDDRWLDTALLATYAGTTGAEGAAALKGTVKPLALGAPRYVPGVLIDSVNSVFQVSGYGAVQGFEYALERLLRFGAPTADYATYAALVAATIPAGRWATAKAVGMARFGAPPTGQVSFLLQGDAAGTDGWARKPGQLIRRLAILSGGSGKINDASLNALDVARPYNGSIYIDQQTTAREVIQKIAASVNAVAVVSWTGELFVLPVGLTTPTLTLAADGSALPPVGTIEQIDMGAPWRKLAISAERTWQVHSYADIAGQLIDMGDYNSGTTYREDNIVQDQGSSWRYIHATPAAGQPPPTLPTTVNSYWKILAQGGSGTNGYSNALVYLFKRSPSSPAVPSATLTFTFATGVLAGGSLDGWTQTPPAGTDPLYVTAASANSTGPTDTIATGEWASPVVQGAGGTNGLNAATVYLYQRAATAPAVPTATLTYTFATGVLAGGSLAGWSQTIPAGSQPIWVITGTAISTAATDTIATGEWATPNILAQDGAAGPSGYSAAQILLFKRGATAPAVPAATLTYTFATDALTGSLSGWSRSPPAADGNPLYVIAASASSNTGSDTIATGEWSSPIVQAQDGGAGTAGLNVATVFLYKRAISAPAVPGSTTTFTFASGVLSGTLSGWTQSLPSGTDPVYYTTATAVSSGPTDTIATGEWATPQILAQNGSDGTSPYQFDLSKQAVDFQLTTAGVMKSGQLPNYILPALTQGTTDVVGSASFDFAISDSTNINVSYSGGFIQITKADVAGYVDVTPKISGTAVAAAKRIVITRTPDPTPPAGQNSGSRQETMAIQYADTALGAQVSSTLAVAANVSGVIYFNYYYLYSGTNFVSSNPDSRMAASCKLQYRLAGAGTWSDATAESLGSEALVPGNVTGSDFAEGEWYGAGSVTGLTAGSAYEFRLIGRRNSTWSGTGTNKQVAGPLSMFISQTAP